MAQKLREDKIGTLTGNSSITMAASSSNPAWLTIGGQQYRITTPLVVTTVVSAANTRYQVYAVLSGGVPVLVISANENSVGPAGYTSWKLVGSYYTDGVIGSVGFGAFVNIEGAPSSGYVLYHPDVFEGSNSKNSDYSQRLGYWKRDGDVVTYEVFLQANANARSGGTAFKYGLPFTAATGGSRGGSYWERSAGISSVATSGIIDTPYRASLAQGTNAAEVLDYGSGPVGYNNGTLNPASSQQTFFGDYKVSGWSNTPIKDL